MKYIIILIIFILTSSCNDYTYFEKEITKDGNCWVFSGTYPPKNKYIYKNTYGGNRFLKNGEIYDILVVNGVKQKQFYFEKFEKPINKWNIDENGVLSFYRYKFKILKISKDTLIVKNIDSINKLYFINIPPKKENIKHI
ncbi:hypothetical protein OX284_012165 [Flavobacterium sp. SUN046]|uniref:hypothetical protein n=1 Tax=Flavobacterium sp. SUN046 TaxID=3002440 RepID=UPI002DC00F38|nr:hypothetical protein [Flavobacterium sp. SUN046]MEC4050188.1 hypothetical protein [Flavobacterium sp. SUN046]